jgi:lactate permease
MNPALLALVPCAVVIATVLGLGWSGLAAAAASLAVTLALVLAGAFAAPTAQMFSHAGLDAALLTCLVAATTVPGVIFIEATRRLKSPEAIARLVTALRLPEPQTAILIALGLGVMVESLTGNGVSLLLTMPLLAGRFDRSRAIALALIGMSLMPWGALAIAGTVGATLANIDSHPFGIAIWRASGPVAALLPLLATWITGARTKADWGAALLCSAVLFAATGLGTLGLGMAMAGVAGGVSILALLAVRAERTSDWQAARSAAALRPYAILIAAAAAQTLLVSILAQRGLRPAIATDRVSFAIFASPGVALIAASLISAWRTFDAALARDVARRSWRAVASVALFMLTARLLVSSGAIEALTSVLRGLGGTGALLSSIGLGAIGGFVTGSGVTGNALFLPSAAAAGSAFDAKTLFAALASAAAGHTAMASLPVAALLLAAMPNRTRADDRTALRWGLTLAAIYLATLAAFGFISLAAR